MNIMLWLKFICPVIVLCIVWLWNRKRQRTKFLEELRNHIEEPSYYMFSGVMTPDLGNFILSSDLEGLKDVIRYEIRDVWDDAIKVYRVMKGETLIAAIIFAWPSGLWTFRQKRGETSLGAYSHIFGVEVSERYRMSGYFYKLMDLVISDTYRISSGITIDLPKNSEIVKLFEKKFEFKQEDNKRLILTYGDWS